MDAKRTGWLKTASECEVGKCLCEEAFGVPKRQISKLHLLVFWGDLADAAILSKDYHVACNEIASLLVMTRQYVLNNASIGGVGAL